MTARRTPSTQVAVDQRSYFVRMAENAANRRAAQLEVAAQRAVSAASTTAALAEAGTVALAAREWRRIAKACTRELNRLARLRHWPAT